MPLYPKNIESVLVGIPRTKGSKIYIVDSVNGSDSNTGLNWEMPFLTLDYAYSKCTTGHNDCIILIANGTAYTTTAALAWAKDRVHVVGLSPIGTAGPGLMEPQVRITCPAALATTPFVTLGGSGCIFRNLQFWHNTTNAAGLVCVYVTGGYNHFENCQFAGGIGTNLITGAISLQIGGAVGGNAFKGCIIGSDAVIYVDGMIGLKFLTAAQHNIFDDCIFLCNTAGTTYVHAKVTALGDVGPLNIFRRCLFLNYGAGAMAQAILTVTGMTPPKDLILTNCWLYGATVWQVTNFGLLTDVTIATQNTGVATGNILKITS
jgi:hypothetical protein